MDISHLSVAVVCPYSMDVPGGVQNQVIGLARHLRSAGAAVTVFAPGGLGSRRPGFSSIGKPRAFRDNGSVTRTVIAPRRLAELARRVRGGRYDIVHVHEPMLPPCLAAIAATSAPVAATFHMSAPEARWYHRFLPVVRRAHRRIEACMAVSPEAARFAGAVLPGEYRIVPNAIDLEEFAGEARRRAGDGPVRLLFVGRADPRKGLPVLQGAFARLSVTARLDIVGTSGRSSDPRVRFHGRVGRFRLRRMLKDADVLCVPSLGSESFGMVVLEAMAAGTAVVASDLPAHERLLSADCGRLVPAGDDLALAAVLDELLAAPAALRRMGHAGRRRARRYDWSEVMPAILDTYADAELRRRFWRRRR